MARQPIGDQSPGVIELLGPPGAGKTSVLHEVISLGEWGAVADPLRPRKVGVLGRLRMLWSSPVVGGLSYLVVTTRRDAGLSNLSRVYLVQRAHLLVRGSPAAGGLLMDEGPVHGLFVALYGTRGTWISRHFLRRLVAVLARGVTRYIYIDAPIEECVRNFTNRVADTSRFARSSSEDEIEAFRNDRTYAEILTCLEIVASRKLCRVGSADEARALLGGE